MDNFYISITPDVGIAPNTYSIDSVLPIKMVAIADGIGGKYDLEFVLRGKRYGYWPDRIAEVLVDLLAGIETLEKRRDAPISIAGYTVLLAEFVNSEVRLYEPHLYSNSGKEAALAGVFSVDQMICEYKTSLTNLYYFIECKLNQK
ncbi:hypothetical protein [Henriciella algicola]|uniref:hypothetical protein n=1 Tax=Henriciella algicola TaxID=1608422 RepID=UPI0011C4432F|nr:hypothetical protein [Henriciella algicola]